jgi:hypothetical protein
VIAGRPAVRDGRFWLGIDGEKNIVQQHYNGFVLLALDWHQLSAFTAK